MLEPKYQINQVIYYIYNSRVHSARVLSRMAVENKHTAYTESERDLFTPFGESGIMYATVHGIFKEKYVFASKEELIESL